MNNNFEEFIVQWDNVVIIWSQIVLVIAGFILLLYAIVLLSKRGLANRHTFISRNEIKYLWYSGLSITLSITFFINYHLVKDLDTTSSFELTFKTLGSIAVGFLVGYSIHTYLNVYYPFRMSKRLHKLRFKPRISPKTGKPMKLLDEGSEDVHLTDDMIQDELWKAFEYDVWWDEESKFKIIEKYDGSHLMELCESCNYSTSRFIREEVELEPSDSEPGIIKKYYKCLYCDHEQEKESRVPKMHH